MPESVGSTVSKPDERDEEHAREWLGERGMLAGDAHVESLTARFRRVRHEWVREVKPNVVRAAFETRDAEVKKIVEEVCPKTGRIRDELLRRLGIERVARTVPR